MYGTELPRSSWLQGRFGDFESIDCVEIGPRLNCSFLQFPWPANASRIVLMQSLQNLSRGSFTSRRPLSNVAMAAITPSSTKKADITPLPDNLNGAPYKSELERACAAVRLASKLCQVRKAYLSSVLDYQQHHNCNLYLGKPWPSHFFVPCTPCARPTGRPNPA